jgi:murein L,D-transpeptidase YcbB/YkuD
MGGRPRVVGLLAAVAVALFANQLATAPLCAQMRIPLFGGDSKPNVVKKKHYQPTLPARNPLRVTAGVSVDAVAPPQAENSEVSAAVGMSSSASVTATASTAPESSGSSDSSDTQPSQSDASAPLQDAAAPAPEAERAADQTADEPAAAPDKKKQSVEAPADEAPSAPAETAAAPAEDDAAAPNADKDASAADEVPISPPDGEQATESAAASPATDITEPVKKPSYNASVVLEVSPPPDAPPQAASDETPPADTRLADAKETQTAALTPPNAPVPDKFTPPDEDKSAGTPDEDAARPAAAEDAKPSGGNAEPATAEPTSAEPTEAEPVVEQAPAHPVVAAIRAKLADPSSEKGVSAAELKALEEFYGTREGPPLWITDAGFSDKAKALIAEIGKADDWGLDSSDFAVPRADSHPATEDDQAEAELKLDLGALKYARYAEGGRRSPSSYNPLFDQRPPVRDPKTVLSGLAAASNPDAYLISLQPQHEQFKRLHQALLKARERAKASGTKPDNDGDVQLIVMNMERWRWLPRQLGALYVWNNVPEYNTRVIKNGKTIYVEKVIVGQLKYATPLFSARMRNIVFHPNWTVPPTIVNEDLAPALQGGGGLFNSNTAILSNHGLSVSLKGQPVDPDSVDWKNVNVRSYTFTQDPGPDNVLGQLKFNFPNRHAIYMHDTVQPELFDQTVRSLSHGCIRVHDPDKFAAVLLGEDKGWSIGQVRSLLAKSETSVITLNRHMPVHLTYFTAVVDEHGTVNKLGDIYGIDNSMAKKMFDNPARFPIPASPDVEASSRGQSTSRQAAGGLDNFISGLFGN